MIKELKLSNFCLFDKEVKVRFRPITILIGENNAGKSSVIKFLLMLQQSLDHGSGFLASQGPKVDLGSFAGLRNKAGKKQEVAFSLEAADNGSPSLPFLEYLKDKGLNSNDERKCTASAEVLCSKENQFIGKKQKIALFVKNQKVIERLANISPNSSLFDFFTEQQEAALETMRRKPENLEAIQKQIVAERFCTGVVRHELSVLRHLSAIRQELPRAVDAGLNPPPKDVGQQGQHTISQLKREGILEKEDKKSFLLKHAERAMGIDCIGFEENAGLAQCYARNKRTRARVNIAEFGFGVNQCLPIFVQGLLMPPRSQLMVEQPEAHVHPTAQIEMGSFFAELWKQYQVGSIIETHSDNLLLRIRNHVARGVISVNEVSIAFFTLDGQGNPIVKNLDIHDNGTIQEGLPMEFFGGDLIEILKDARKT